MEFDSKKMKAANSFSPMKPIFKTPNIRISDQTREMQQTVERVGRELSQERRLNNEANASQLRSERLLQQISDNTASLADIAQQLHESNLKQEQIVELMGDIFAISKASNATEAESLYQKTIGKISEFGEDAGNIATLVTTATTIFNAVKSLF